MPPTVLSTSTVEDKKNYHRVKHNRVNPIIFSEMVSGKQEAADHCHSEGPLSLLPNVLVQQVCEPSL